MLIEQSWVSISVGRLPVLFIVDQGSRILSFMALLHHCLHPAGRRAKTKEEHVGVVYELNPEVDMSLLLTLHWLELSHMTIPNYKGDLEMYSCYALRKKKKGILVNS